MQSYMLVQFLKYVLEGLAVAIAAYLISGTKKSGMKGAEILGLALTAAATFAVLDVFAPSVAVSARQGTGFGLGAQQVGWPMGEGFRADYDEAFDSKKHDKDRKDRKKEGFTAEVDEAFMHHEDEGFTASPEEEPFHNHMPEVEEAFNPDAEYEEGFYARPDMEDGTEAFYADPHTKMKRENSDKQKWVKGWEKN